MLKLGSRSLKARLLVGWCAISLKHLCPEKRRSSANQLQSTLSVPSLISLGSGSGDSQKQLSGDGFPSCDVDVELKRVDSWRRGGLRGETEL